MKVELIWVEIPFLNKAVYECDDDIAKFLEEQYALGRKLVAAPTTCNSWLFECTESQ